jgi:CO/xanthine dehydrogenase FAD-binding subunit
LPGIAEIADARTEVWRPGDSWLGGGTWLFSEPQPAVTRLLDLGAFGWPSLVAGTNGLEIAATCTLAELYALRAPQWAATPLIRQCCNALLGSFKVWNAATVGGNMCLALPAGPMTSFTSALDGVCTVWDRSGAPRDLPVTDFVTGAGQCALAPGELLRSVRLPAAALACTTAFRQIALAPLGRSGAVVIGRRSPAGDSVVVTVTAATVAPVQVRFAGLPARGDLLDAITAANPCYHDDVHGTPAWRAAVTRELAAEVLAELAAR